jgi:hypothetical protein
LQALAGVSHTFGACVVYSSTVNDPTEVSKVTSDGADMSSSAAGSDRVLSTRVWLCFISVYGAVEA